MWPKRLPFLFCVFSYIALIILIEENKKKLTLCQRNEKLTKTLWILVQYNNGHVIKHFTLQYKKCYTKFSFIFIIYSNEKSLSVFLTNLSCLRWRLQWKPKQISHLIKLARIRFLLGGSTLSIRYSDVRKRKEEEKEEEEEEVKNAFLAAIVLNWPINRTPNFLRNNKCILCQ